MRPALLNLALPALLGVMGAAQSVRLPQVFERTLGNGMKVLVVERPGTGSVHARIFVRGGRADTGGLPPAAADLLARTVFRRVVPQTLEAGLEPLLDREGGAFEALRLERLARERQPLGAEGAPGNVAPDHASLQALEAAARTSLEQRVEGVASWDLLDSLGATGRELSVTADYLASGADLPASAVPAWARIEADRVRNLPMGRFPMERDQLVQEIDAGAPPSPAALSVLLATAMSGRPYALAGEFQASQVQAVTWTDLAAYGRQALTPENLCLALVGDVKGAALLPQLEKTFGALPRGRAHWDATQVFQAGDAVSSLESPGGRRLIVSTTGDTRLFFGWRVPAANHPDNPALRALAQILGGSPSARLEQNLMESRSLARSLTVTMGVPGRRDVNLLVIEAEPAEGHSLDELEQAIQDQILRLQREQIADPEVRQAQVQLEAGEVQVQEDAATLAEALGRAQCQGGDWRLAFRALEADGGLKAPEIQRVARTYLVPPRATIAVLGPDPLLLPLDRTESRLLQVLTALLGRRLGSPAQAQTVLREALRQLRMLSPAEREQTLSLLESQVRP